jgi:O-antigen ligase
MRVYQTASNELMVLEAHNDYLQLAAEGGLLVGVPIVLTLVLFGDAIRRRFSSGEDDPVTSWIRFGAATALAAIALQSVVEFSLQMPGNAVLFSLFLAIAARRSSNRRRAVRAPVKGV